MDKSELRKIIYQRIEFYDNKDNGVWGWIIHRERNLQTILRIVSTITKYKSIDVLVLGEPSLIDWVIHDLKLCPETRFFFSGQQDLRRRLTFKSNSFDLVINTEVLEHIKDLPEAPRDKFDFSGANNFLTECRRLLKVGGIMVFSTPNACSRKSLIRNLLQKDSKMFFFHVREYAPKDVLHLLVNHQFQINYLETLDVYKTDENTGLEFDFGKLSNEDVVQFTNEIFEKYGFDDKWRGDLIFVECKKLKVGATAEHCY